MGRQWAGSGQAATGPGMFLVQLVAAKKHTWAPQVRMINNHPCAQIDPNLAARLTLFGHRRMERPVHVQSRRAKNIQPVTAQ